MVISRSNYYVCIELDFNAQVKKFAKFWGIAVNMLVKIVRKKNRQKEATQLNLVRDHKGRRKL